MTFVFKHPKYYKELRSRNKLDQAISTDRSRDKSSVTPIERSPGPGHKQQAASDKLQAPSESSNKPQASSPKQQASSSKPQATSSVIRVPRYKNTEEVFLGKGPRAFTMINVFLG